MLEQKIGYKPSFSDRIYRFALKHPGLIYLGPIFFLTLIFTYAVISLMGIYVGAWALLPVSIIIFILNSDIAVNLVNSVLSRLTPVRLLPKIDYVVNDIPDKDATLVVIPSVFRSKILIGNLLRKLEVHYLGNRDKNIFFGLLMDFRDSKNEINKEDSEYIKFLENGIDALNKKYKSAGSRDRFFSLYRHRIFNEKDKVFMGWERKRGALREFNKLILGDEDVTYAIPKNGLNVPSVRYVVTLDDDTEVPQDTIKKMIGCISHPLNKPILKRDEGRVSRGYGIIQPQIATRIDSAKYSLFSNAFAFSIGLDSYSRPSPDVYQDLFGNAIFFGKGIYDVEVVEETMKDNIPENRVLSHDLLEGLYAKTGLSSDIQVFDGFPQNYNEYLTRLHRWIRGDWQIIHWLRPNFLRVKDGMRGNRFGVDDKWRILDNLRRSLIPPFSLVIIFFILFSPLHNVWDIYPIIILGSPFVIVFFAESFSFFRTFPFIDAIKMVVYKSFVVILQIFTRLSLLFQQSIVYVDAIARAVSRLFITKKKLLQWTASQEAAKENRGGLIRFYKSMWLTPFFSGAMSLILYFLGFGGVAAYVWLSLWFLSPFIAYILSLPRHKKYKPRESDINFLRGIAYRNFRYFIEFSNQSNNWLIPDHLQEYPRVARTEYKVTTSPTNLGALINSLMIGYELGYISFERFINNLTKTFHTLSSLERFKGHFYNWYDVKTLKPLFPKYISSVDSANMLANMLVLQGSLKELRRDKILGNNLQAGFLDALGVLREDLHTLFRSPSAAQGAKKYIKKISNNLNKIIRSISVRNTKKLSGFLNILNEIALFNSDTRSRLAGLEFTGGEEFFVGIEKSLKFLEELVEECYRTFQSGASFYKVFSNIPVRKEIVELRDFYALIAKIIDKVPSIGDFEADRLEIELDSVRLDSLSSAGVSKEEIVLLRSWIQNIRDEIKKSKAYALSLIKEASNISENALKIFNGTEFKFLYNKERGLFHIGYNASFNKIDNAYYDFMASEANLISFIGILKGDVPQKHWFHLGRKLVRVGNKGVMLSWGGSLFEYLTSLLFLNVHPESLIGETARTAIKTHRNYARLFAMPWGIGESAYNMFDASQSYQYQVFGVPILGLKRGLKDYRVVAPYTTALALRFYPKIAIRNFKRLGRKGVLGIYGFYDAFDYTGTTGFKPASGIPVKIYYAHHQGFTLAGISNLIQDGRMIKLFHMDPRVESISALLEEGAPRTIPLRPVKSASIVPKKKTPDTNLISKYIPIKTRIPRYALLSNGNYFLAVSNSGAGYSKYQDIQLTRFKDDPVLEEWGSFIYMKDLDTSELWSPTFQPMRKGGKKNKIIFHENRVEFRQFYNNIESNLRVFIPSVENMEIRELSLTNAGDVVRNIEVASFGEVVMTKPGADKDHPMFHKLMVESEFIARHRTLLFNRRHPSDRSRKIYFAHSVILPRHAELMGYARSREDFLGRNGSISKPAFIHNNKIKKDLEPKHTLDSTFSLNAKISIKPGDTAKIVFINSVGSAKEEIMRLIKKQTKNYSSRKVIHENNNLSIKTLKDINISAEDAILFQSLASRIMVGEIKPMPSVARERKSIIESLWRHGISGDFPILSVRVKDIEDAPFVKQILLFNQYMRYKGLDVDIVVLNEHPSSYIRTLDDEIDFMIRSNRAAREDSGGGGVFHLKSDLVSDIDKEILLFASRFILDSKSGALSDQISVRNGYGRTIFGDRLGSGIKPSLDKPNISLDVETQLFNGFGGFDSKDGSYVFLTGADDNTPSSWANIVTNDKFGFLMRENGSSFTWSEDSYDNRLTALNRDEYRYGSGEIFYIKDDETGEVWSPTPYPSYGRHLYRVTHGRGFSSFDHNRNGIEHKFLSYVPVDDPVKIVNVKLKNLSSKSKKLSLVGLFEPVLGSNKEDTRHVLDIKYNSSVKAVLVENKFRSHLRDRIAFFDMAGGNFVYSFNREHFLGRHGSINYPSALHRERIDKGQEDLGENIIDNCIALQAGVDLAPGEEKEIIALIGEGTTKDEVKNYLSKYRSKIRSATSLSRAIAKWENGPFKIDCPDKSLNMLFNDWLLYQILSSRIMGKTGYYQSSGAYGFRDQLQDSMALIYREPALVRQLILKAAKHQFKEGDAQNWWHDHNNFGIRTAFSDHQLWLPYVITSYINITGDESVLEEREEFLDGPRVNFIDRLEWVGVPDAKTDRYSIYEHCIRAINHTMKFGPNGLPLFGVSDWNDSLNKVGVEGKGESVWLGWFLYATLMRFSNLSEKRGDYKNTERFRAAASGLQRSLEEEAWDGSWYKRAFMDNRIPLGSSQNQEFKIDSIAQSWSVLSGGGKNERAKRAIESALGNLVDGDVVRLLAPPLQSVVFDPGSIKDYPPGVRENGGQYNHAALWLAQALFVLGDGDSGKKILDLINPALRSQKDVARYRVEPYVLSSEVYAPPSYDGRGGWTWYTGSAGLFYRTILEFIFGLNISKDTMTIDPCLPKDWDKCSISYKLGNTEYLITIYNPNGVNKGVVSVKIDGRDNKSNTINILNDGRRHKIVVKLGFKE
ncbi:MAG TPA: glucoamylase family protein [Candidatus Paceibacterota bacterium]